VQNSKPLNWVDLVQNLVSKEVKVRYVGSVIGFAWSLGNPLVVCITFFFVFTYVLPSNQDRFALHLVTGIIHWMLFNQIIQQSCDWLTGNSNLIRKIKFPRVVLPISGYLTVLIFWTVAILIYAFLYKFLGGQLASELVWYPLVLIPYLLMIMGIGLTVSVLQVKWRDTKHFTEVFVPLLFWLTPIVWVTSDLPKDVARFLALNPLTPFFNSFTAILHGSMQPSPNELALCWCIAVGFLISGILVFRCTDKVIELL
jgi:lipopolysaccharide transport system permease protein